MLSTAPAPLSIWDVFSRMLCAMAVGTVIGTEREYSNRPAGMRTHILVALGACAVMMTGQIIFIQYFSYGATPDPARLAAQVITGVGFLGAGTIMKEGPTVHGLTTAASLWAVACLGVTAGAGFYSVALIGMIFIFITLTFFEMLQNRLVGQNTTMVCYRVEAQDIIAALDALNTYARRQNAGICDMRTDRCQEDCYTLHFRVEIGGLHSKRRRQQFIAGLTAEPAIDSIAISGRQKEPQFTTQRENYDQ